MDTDTNKSALQRYADVNTLMLTTYAEKCQDFTYASMISDLTKIDWDSNTAAGGRQIMSQPQSCIVAFVQLFLLIWGESAKDWSGSDVFIADAGLLGSLHY